MIIAIFGIIILMLGLKYYQSDDLSDKQFGLTLVIIGVIFSVPVFLWEEPKNLLEILKTNGTGILEGTCRSKDGRPFMDSVFPEEVQDPVDINFSFGAHYLGCYSFDCEGSDEPDDKNDLYVSYGPLVLDDSSTSVYVYIYYDRVWEVSRFTARLDKQT